MSLDENWWNVTEAARYVRSGPKMIRREVRDGRLRASRLGKARALRFRPSWLDDWMESSAPLIHAKVNDGQSSEEAS